MDYLHWEGKSFYYTYIRISGLEGTNDPVTKRENVIEINGKRYDAYTGALLNAASPAQTAVVRSVDGLTHPAHHASKTAKPAHAVAAVHPPKIMDVNRPNPQHLRHHAPKKSATLVRSAVSKPSGSLKRQLKIDSHTHALVAQPNVTIVKKLSHPKVDIQRQKRAVHTPRSDYVRRYSEPAKLVSARTLEAAAIKPVHASTPLQHQVSTPHASSMDVFERALQQANSHLEPLHTQSKKHKQSKWSKRVLSISAASLAVLIISAFVVLQNQANLNIKYASHKAGISASLPAAQPAGFHVGKLSYSPGSVAVNFTNSSSGQNFAVKQTASNWDSSALKDNFVASADKTYHAIQAAGRTVYTYGDGNATWVNDGIWYNVTSDGSLTTNELLDLAKSM